MKRAGPAAIGLGMLLHLAIIIGSAAAATAPSAERRVALVIGNSAYQEISPLANPSSDARLVAETLEKLGFELIGVGPMLDQDFLALRRAIRSFGEALKGGAVGLFYYAGHGIEYNGKNYLVPTNASLNTENDIAFELIDANLVLQQMELAGNDLNMMILDACRNNPFASRGFRAVGRGLGRMDAPAGTIISFATRPGDVAADGSGANSPFTTALARAIQTPNLGVLEVFNKVGVLVKTETGGSQQPWLSSSPIEGQFYFKLERPSEREQPLVDTRVAGLSASTPDATSAPSTFDARTMDLEFWRSIKDSNDPALYQAYLDGYPNGAFAPVARARIVDLETPTKTAAIPPPQEEDPPPAKPAPPEAAAVEIDTIDAEYVALKNANVRAAPDARAEKAGSLRKGAKVAVLGKVRGTKWYMIELEDGRHAYVYAPLLGLEDSVEVARVEVARVQPPRQTRTLSSPKRPAVGEVFNVIPVEYGGRPLQYATDIIRLGLANLPDSAVIVEPDSRHPADTMVSATITRATVSLVSNPDYQGAQIAKQFLGRIVALGAVNPQIAVYDAEIIVAAKRQSDGRTISDRASVRLKMDPQINQQDGLRQAVQTATQEAVRRLVIRLTGGVPQPQATAQPVQIKPAPPTVDDSGMR